jgi:hypothetical protein
MPPDDGFIRERGDLRGIESGRLSDTSRHRQELAAGTLDGTGPATASRDDEHRKPRQTRDDRLGEIAQRGTRSQCDEI